MRIGKPVLFALSLLALLGMLSVVHVDPALAQALKDVVVVNPPTQPVPVGNTQASPLFTRSADAAPSETPYNFEIVAGVDPGYSSGDAVVAIVEGNRELFIEHVSVGGDVPPDERAFATIFATDRGTGNLLWTHLIPLTGIGDRFVVGDFAKFIGSQPMRIRVKGTPAGVQITMRFIRSSEPSATTRSAGFSATLSGYTIP